MKGDFTRSTFRSEKHYRSVRMQQGRVQLDADWNEQGDIAAYRDEVATLDVIGESGGSRQTAGFALARSAAELPTDQQDAAKKLEPLRAGDLFISAGRYYVDGILCENEHPVTLARQPDDAAGGLPIEAGVYLAFLDVWQRHLTALDDSEILEVALGGPDTATRTKTVWQVKLKKVKDEGVTCGSVIPELEDETAPSSGRLSARAEPATTTDDPCLLEPGAGYRRLENQLYRVEIHEEGPLGAATFKWSRDNGSVVTAWRAQSGNDLTVSSIGKDRILGFAAGDWVELTDDTKELQGLPGILVKVTGVQGQIVTIDPDTTVVDRDQFPSKPKVRRWDMGPGGALTVNDGFIELEGGVQVKFEPGAYKTGDYWLIPARTATGSIEWPFTDPQLPQGIVHHYCRLGLLTFDKTQYTSLQDCRKLSPPVTELTSLFYVGGDGQVAAPGQALPQLLQVGVANGQWQVPGATVRFAITQGSGTLQSAGTTADVVTTADGVASCAWQLGFGTQSQQVQATLLDSTKNPVHLPVRFNASFSGDAQDAGIQIERILLGDGSTLDNDANVTVDRLALVQGIQVICTESIALGTVSRANCFLTMEMPFPMSLSDTVFWGQDLIGYQPLVVAALPHANGSMLVWTPTPAVSAWLRDDLFRQVATLNRFPRILARLTILGNFIWQSGNPELFLDADAFGMQSRPGVLEPTRLRLPSGDGRRGGRLDMWFWVVPEITIEILPETATLQRPNVSVNFAVTIEGAVNRGAVLSVNGVVGGNAATGKITLTDEALGTWTYVAPVAALDASILSSMTAIVTAASVADPTRVAQATVTVRGSTRIDFDPIGPQNPPAPRTVKKPTVKKKRPKKE